MSLQVEAAVAERMIGLSKREGLWRGLLFGFLAGSIFGTGITVLVIRGMLS